MKRIISCEVMKNEMIKKIWNSLKRKTSILLIICLIISSIVPANSVYAKNTAYKLIDELEITDDSIDDGMFYMPYNFFDVNENDDKNQYVFKVLRKGTAEKAEKVKLTMVDITAKYDRDYSIKVIDKLFFKENVQNRLVSKSVDEFMRSSEYEEYNYSDAIVDGSIKPCDVMSKEEQENYKMSDDEKDKVLNDAKTIFDEYNLSGEIERIDSKNEAETETELENETEKETELEKVTETETEVETETTTIENKLNETVNGFTKTDTKEETTTDEETTTEEQTITEEQTTTEEHTTTEEQTTIEEETTTKEQMTTEEETTTKEQTTTEEQTTTKDKTSVEEETTIVQTTTEETTTEEQTTAEEQTTIKEQTTKEETETEKQTTTDKETTTKEQTTTIVSDKLNKELVPEENLIGTQSEVIYGDETIQFETLVATKSSMSMKEAYEAITGKKSDKKHIILDRSENSLIPNKNSLDDLAYMNDSIKAVEEELKSAYVILEFKEGQTEKLIEISIKNDNKYRGTRQVGFNLSSVDGSLIAGLYSSLTLQIHDDEEVEPTYINFSNKNYSPKDGYITITIERSGDLSSIATCMIDTEDITAKANRDYSKVHAELIFGLGVNVRKVKIPIVSKYIDDTAAFKLKLQEPKGALIGDNATAICNIKKSDKSFEVVNDKENKENLNTNKNANSNSNDKLFGNDNSNLNELTTSNNNSNNNLFGAGGKDYDLDSVILGDPIDLQKCIKNFKFKNANGSSNNYYINDGKGYHVYLENHNWRGQSAYCFFDIDTAGLNGGYRYDWSGVQFDWEATKENSDITLRERITPENSEGYWRKFYEKEDTGFNRKTSDFILENDAMTKIYFWLRREGGLYGESPSINIYAIRPILKMYKISLIGTDVPALINDDGVATSTNKYAKYALTSIEGSKSDHTAVGWTGKTITVKLDNTVNNPFYIKRLWMRTSSTGGSWSLITQNFDSESTSISFKMDDNFATKYKDFINDISRPGGGKNGEFKLYAELDVKSSVVKVEKDERVNVKIWNKSPHEVTDMTDNWWYHVGDTLHFTAEVKPEYKAAFECNGLNIYRIKPYSPDWITIRKPLTGDNYFPLDLEYSEIKVVPVLSRTDNVLIVRVPKDKVSLFDLSYGIFTKAKYEVDDYYEYYVETESQKISGNYFELKAKCLDDKNVPVWYENNKKSIKYTQNTYYFLASTEADDNIVYLTCEPADDKKYSIEGTAYYEEAAIGGKTTDRYWQTAPYVGVVIDDYHFGYADDKGEFTVIPGQGKAGYYKKLKVVSNSYDRYINVELNKNHPETKTYVVTYEDGDHSMSENVYSINAGEVLISNITKEHPYITGVKSTNMDGSVFGAVYINDNITVLKASVSPKKADGSDFIYTYKEEDGTEVTATESVKRVEFVVVDMQNHSIKKVIEATRSNADKTEWTAYYTFERGNYAEYISGDKLYARIVTDRRIGDGKGEDIEGSGMRIEIPSFMETTYQSIPTTLPFIEEAEKEPYMVNINFPDSIPLSLPIIGTLQSMFNMKGMSFGITTDGDRIRLHLGKVFLKKGNHYDESGKTIADNGNVDITPKNLKSEMGDMADMIKNFGTKRLKAMTLGINAWTFEPIVGIYFEFMVTYNPESTVQTQYEFTGAGGYFGGILDWKYTYYILIYGIPFYVGGSVYLSLVAEIGIAVDAGRRIPLNDPDQGFFNNLLKNSHFDFQIKAILYASAYVGVGICGALGARGGFQLQFLFLWNPVAKLKYPGIRPVGFAISGYIRFWVDAGFLTIPIPLYTWRNFYTLGYFSDLEEMERKKRQNSGNIFGSDSSQDKESSLGEMRIRPRPGLESRFVANDNNTSGLFGGTYEENSTRTLVENVYDSAEPKIMGFLDPVTAVKNKAVLVYLDDDPSQDDLDRTTLKYSIYDSINKSWTEPHKVWEGSHTADFSPVLSTVNGEVLLAWAKRPDPVDENTPKADLFKKMEIYTSFFDRNTEQFGTPVRMTNDDSYDFYPQITSDDNGKIYLYYLKNDNVSDIETSDDLLNNIQPEVSGAHLVYMVHDDPEDGNGARWLTDYYYDYEFPSTMTEEEKQAYITQMNGQRIKDLSINVGGSTPVINDPNIGDYTAESITTIVAMPQEYDHMGQLLEEYKANPSWSTYEPYFRFVLEHTKDLDVVAYVVDDDGNADTKDDTDIYLKLNIAKATESYTVRVTNNSTPDMMPKMLKINDETYLLWIQNNSAIKMVQLEDIIKRAQDEDHASKQIELGEINIVTVNKEVLSDKINNFATFTNSSYDIFLVWQQDSNTDITNISDDGEMEFKQDLYVAGLVRNVVDEEVTKTWTNPVRFTDNGKVNDLPTVASFGDELLFVNNQYNLKSNEEVYNITNSNLQEIVYKKQGSLYITDVTNSIDTVNADESIKYKTMINLQNTGLFEADGFTYNGKITYDGIELTNFSGNTGELVLPGCETRIGGNSYGDNPTTTPAIYFTLTKEQQKHLDKVKVEISVEEYNVAGSWVTSSKEVFDVKEVFSFAGFDGNFEDDYGKITVEQNGDTFVLKGLLKNTGNTDSIGNEKIYVINQMEWDTPIASSDYIDLSMGSQMQFEIPVDSSKILGIERGVKDLVAYVANDEGTRLSDYEIATVNARQAFNFKVNEQAENIRLQKGETVYLTTTYSPNEKYKNATILYTVSDGDIAKTMGNKLYGVNVGTTKLMLTTKEFGGSKEIEVIVTPQSNDDYSGSGSSGVRSGAGPLSSAQSITKVNAVKANSISLDAANISWVYDPVNNIWKLNISNGGTGSVEARNGFYQINKERVTIINGTSTSTIISDIYYFDENGKMITGWVGTADGKWYFFEDRKIMDEGKMIYGWRNIQGAWYYFAADGAMLANTITPDGYRVGADGKHIQ